MRSRPDTTLAKLYPVRYVGSRGVLEFAGKPQPILIDGGKARGELGNKRYFDLFVSKSAVSIKPSLGKVSL